MLVILWSPVPRCLQLEKRNKPTSNSLNMDTSGRCRLLFHHLPSPINNLSFTFPVSCALAVWTFMNHWLLMGHWLFQSQREWGEGAAGSPRGTQTRGRSIIHGSPWACSEHWHSTCLNQTGPVSLMPPGKCKAQVKGEEDEGGSAGHDGEGHIRKDRREGWKGSEGMAPFLTPLALAWKLSAL